MTPEKIITQNYYNKHNTIVYAIYDKERDIRYTIVYDIPLKTRELYLTVNNNAHNQTVVGSRMEIIRCYAWYLPDVRYNTLGKRYI